MNHDKVFKAMNIALTIPVFVFAVLIIFFGLSQFWKSIVEFPLMLRALNEGNYARSGAHGGGLWLGPIVVYLGTRLWKLGRRLLGTPARQDKEARPDGE